MAKKNFKSKNTWSQVLLIGLSCILLIGAIVGVFALFKKNNDIAPKEGSIEYTYEETIENLNNEIKELNAKNSILEEKNAKLENDLKLSGEINSSLQDEINTKDNQIIDLQQCLEAYDKEGKCEVRFQSNGVTQDVVLVEIGLTLTSEQVLTFEQTESACFVGWSLDGEAVVEPTTIPINSNTTFIALWKTIKGTWNVTYVSHVNTGEETDVVTITDDGVEFSFQNREFTYYPETSTDYYYQYGSAKDVVCFKYNSNDDTLVVLFNDSYPLPRDIYGNTIYDVFATEYFEVGYGTRIS